jgi:hypothetical protein
MPQSIEQDQEAIEFLVDGERTFVRVVWTREMNKGG